MGKECVVQVMVKKRGEGGEAERAGSRRSKASDELALLLAQPTVLLRTCAGSNHPSH